MSDPLFGPIFSTPAADAAVAGRAWVAAMLDVEAALARAAEATGLIPAGAGQHIAERCVVGRFDVADIGRRAVRAGTPVIPLVADLRTAVGPEHADHVHLGATSQDIVDTALGLIARRVLTGVQGDLATVADRLGVLADEHRHTAQLGRTLLQPALPTTFGVVCAGWLIGIDEARRQLDAAGQRLAVQLGGPVGTAVDWGDAAGRLSELVARDLQLAVPTACWHTTRNRVAELATASAVTGGALATVALGVTLLAQGQVGEVAEGVPGGSSAMPHKRNPARAVHVIAATHRMPGLVATVLAAMPQELQRATGRWQAEWQTVADLLRLLAAAAAHSRVLVAELHVDTARMTTNLLAAEVPGATSPTAPALRAAADRVVDRVLAAHRELACSTST